MQQLTAALLSDAGLLKLTGFCLLACLAVSCNCLQCYVCGDGDSRHCGDYDSSNQHLFIKDCPPGSESCSNKTNADSVVVLRSCETNRADACTDFQEFKYCYCYENLCNGINSVRLSFPNDDEDIDDGSGVEERKLYPTTSSAPTKSNVSSSSGISEKCNPIHVIIFCVAFFI